MTTALVPPAAATVSIDLATRREFLALLGAAGLLTGCATDAPPALGDDTVTVDDLVRGPVEIPRSPQRVFTLEGRLDLEAALALRLPVIGTGVSRGRLSAHLDPATVGDTTLPIFDGGLNIERVAALDPDLIIAVAATLQAEEAAGLDGVAPIITVDSESPWQDQLRQLGRLLDRIDDAEAAIAAYDAEAAAVRTEFGELITSTRVGIVQADPGALFQAPTWLIRAVALDLGADLVEADLPEGTFDISYEQTGFLADADVIVQLLDPDDSADALAGLESNPLWPQLPAVAAGKVLPADYTSTNFGGVFAARRCLQILGDAYALAR